MKTKSYQIEKNVPPPKSWAKMAKEMKVGHSVMVENHGEMDSLRGAIRKTGAKAQVKQFYPKYRVWKV